MELLVIACRHVFNTLRTIKLHYSSLLQVYRIPSIYIYQFNAPVYFANVGVFRARLFLETKINPSELGEGKQGCIQQGCLRVSIVTLKV